MGCPSVSLTEPVIVPVVCPDTMLELMPRAIKNNIYLFIRSYILHKRGTISHKNDAIANICCILHFSGGEKQ